jgi:hypothetical protein
MGALQGRHERPINLDVHIKTNSVHKRTQDVLYSKANTKAGLSTPRYIYAEVDLVIVYSTSIVLNRRGDDFMHVFCLVPGSTKTDRRE